MALRPWMFIKFAELSEKKHKTAYDCSFRNGLCGYEKTNQNAWIDLKTTLPYNNP